MFFNKFNIICSIILLYINNILFSDIEWNVSKIYLILHISYIIYFKINKYNDKFIYYTTSLIHTLYEAFVLFYTLYTVLETNDVSYLLAEKFLMEYKSDLIMTLYINTFNYYIIDTLYFNHLGDIYVKIHHILSIVCSYIFIYELHGIGLLPLLVSMSSIFLNLILLEINSIFVKLSFVILFVVGRIIIPPIYIYIAYEMMMVKYTYIFIYLSSIFMTLINFYWLNKIIIKIIK